jgi:hypothetical protein
MTRTLAAINVEIQSSQIAGALRTKADAIQQGFLSRDRVAVDR